MNLLQRKFLSIAGFWSPSSSFKILMKICRRAIEINNRQFPWSKKFKFWRRSAGRFYHLKQKFNNKNLVIFFRANTKTTGWFEDVGTSLESSGVWILTLMLCLKPTFLCLVLARSVWWKVGSPTRICSAVWRSEAEGIIYIIDTPAVTLNKSAICSLDSLLVLLTFLNLTSFSSLLLSSSKEVLRPNIALYWLVSRLHLTHPVGKEKLGRAQALPHWSCPYCACRG